MKSCEEMTRDVLERRDEEVTRIRKRRRGIIGGVSGLAVCVAAVLLLPGILKGPGQPAGPVSGTDPKANVVWTADSASAVSAESDVSDSLGREPLRIAEKLQSAMDEASPDDYLAFTVGVVVRSDSNDPYDRLKNMTGKTETMDAKGHKSQEAEEALIRTARRLTDRIMQEQDITEVEAVVRAENDPDYIAAKKARLEAMQEQSMVRARAYYGDRKSLVERMQEKGFTVVSTCWEDEFVRYSNIEDCIAVFAGTREMIAALTKEDFGDDIDKVLLYATRPMDDSFFEPPAGRRLAEGSKLTEGLQARYKENGGAAVRVLVHLGWTGEQKDPSDLALQAIGMTRKEYEETKDLSDEIVEKYHEALNYYTYWVRPEVVEPLLKDGELVEIQSGSWAFTADLTYERAMELGEEKMVAYISLSGEAETTDIFERDAVSE